MIYVSLQTYSKIIIVNFYWLPFIVFLIGIIYTKVESHLPKPIEFIKAKFNHQEYLECLTTIY